MHSQAAAVSREGGGTMPSTRGLSTEAQSLRSLRFLLESASLLGACGASQTSAQGSLPRTCEGLKAPARLAPCPVGTQQRRADNEKGWERLRGHTSSFYRWKDSRDRFQPFTHRQWGLGNKPGSLFGLGTSGQF